MKLYIVVFMSMTETNENELFLEGVWTKRQGAIDHLNHRATDDFNLDPNHFDNQGRIMGRTEDIVWFGCDTHGNVNVCRVVEIDSDTDLGIRVGLPFTGWPELIPQDLIFPGNAGAGNVALQVEP